MSFPHNSPSRRIFLTAKNAKNLMVPGLLEYGVWAVWCGDGETLGSVGGCHQQNWEMVFIFLRMLRMGNDWRGRRWPIRRLAFPAVVDDLLCGCIFTALKVGAV